MTIHGSKGLEFKYTIVLDRFGGRAPNRDMLIFNYETPVKIDKIYYKFAKKENFIKDYKIALNEQKELSAKDRLNLLYVAFTRAELALSIVKKDKSSEFDILNLQEQKIGSVPKTVSEVKKEPNRLNIKISRYGLQEHSSVSENDDADIINYENIYFGEALHYCLELANLKESEFKDAYDSLYNRYGYILSKEAIDDIGKRVKMLLENREFKSIIDSGSLYKEQPLVYKESFYQIDLLVKGESNIIIDYKSSKNFANKHIEQIKNYIDAIKSIENKDTIGYIIYLLRDRVEIKKV